MLLGSPAYRQAGRYGAKNHFSKLFCYKAVAPMGHNSNYK